jgi:SAM-dependent methyltransferase
MTTDEHLERMRKDWDQRARENARYYVASSQSHWDENEFYASGEETVRHYIRNDLGNICQGKRPEDMRVLEIGCGTGRVTCALARFFGEVHAVDISGEMVARARAATAPFSNVRVYQNNGRDLDVLPPVPFDFAYSQIVFQHIPSREIIQNYVSATARCLRPGALFKFQLQGGEIPDDVLDTWLGVGYSEEQARQLAQESGFDLRAAHGAGTQDFWLWFFARDRVAQNRVG